MLPYEKLMSSGQEIPTHRRYTRSLLRSGSFADTTPTIRAFRSEKHNTLRFEKETCNITMKYLVLVDVTFDGGGIVKDVVEKVA